MFISMKIVSTFLQTRSVSIVEKARYNNFTVYAAEVQRLSPVESESLQAVLVFLSAFKIGVPHGSKGDTGADVRREIDSFLRQI